MRNMTKREEQVLGLVCKGLSNQEIAVMLCIEASTVNVHVMHLYSKLLKNKNRNPRVQLVDYAHRNKLLRLKDEGNS